MPYETHLLSILFSYEGEHVSGKMLSEHLGISRATVSKYAQSLKSMGYHVESSPKLGYRLKDYSSLLIPKNIKRGLRTSVVGKKMLHFFEISSTNSVARQIASQFVDTDGTVVVAECQTGGKGRINRPWVSPLGGVWLSIILKPNVSPNETVQLTYVTAVSVAKTLKTFGLDAKIKWPNDVLIGGRKVCGILNEISATPDRVNYVIIGMGINANVDVAKLPLELREHATSMMRELGKPVDRVALVKQLLMEFEENYKLFHVQFSSIIDEWKSLSDTIGKRVEIKTPTERIEGDAVGVDTDGGLIVRTDDGSIKRVLCGDCLYLKMSER
ncbi:MAG: biotin--[acetyl-CoA-carboxylase] ligase [Methermicoccaceae archaeon]